MTQTTRLPDYDVLNPELDRLPKEELRGLQSQRLQAMVRYVYQRAPFWQRKLDEAGIHPDGIRSIADLPRLPFSTRAELESDQAANPPFGSYLCSPRTDWVKYMQTSGTAGAPLRRVMSARDWRQVLDRFARHPVVGSGDVVVVLGPVDGLMGPTASLEGMARMGALVIPAGLYDSRAKLRLIEEIRPTRVSGTASYLLHLLEVAGELGIDTRRLGLGSVSCFGEPGAAVPSTRKRLEEGWNAWVADGYGMTEIFPLGGNCRGSTALHIASDLALVEIVDPVSGQTLAAGELGEVVLSNLVGDTQPLLRYRSRDLSRLAVDDACPSCGFTGARLEGSIVGRVDDMIWLRGVNVFPSAVERVVHEFGELGPEFQMVIDGKVSLPRLTIRVETEAGAGAPAELAARVGAAIKSAVGVNAEVELLPPRSLPRSDGRTKVRRVVDNRSG